MVTPEQLETERAQDRVEFGARLKKARMKLSYETGRPVSQRQIAVQLGFTNHRPILKMEGGSVLPDLTMIRHIARVLDVNPCWLAYGEPAKDAPPMEYGTDALREPPAELPHRRHAPEPLPMRQPERKDPAPPRRRRA